MTGTAAAIDVASDQSWEEYREDGIRRALALGNRGPMRFGDNGVLAQEQLDAYYRCGFYVFTGVLSAEECAELTAEFAEVLENAPVTESGDLDRHGRPVRFPGYYTLGNIRDSRIRQPEADGEEQAAPVHLVSHPLMMMDSALRAYAHPDILRMAASVNGEDFVPFHESIFNKDPGEGAPTPWHQDGRTHWTEDGEALEQRDGSGKTHGFNLSVAWSHCTPENGLWVVPGSHRRWRLANGGKFPPITDRLADAVPMMLEPGDVGMVNRSSLHGSFPNRTPVRRNTMVMGFHKRDSAIGAETTNVHAFRKPGDTKTIRYSEDYVLRRARMIPLAIDARRQRYPGEQPYDYRGSYLGDSHWNERARTEIAIEGNEYWQQDITL